MKRVIIKAKQTLAGVYGQISEGEETTLHEKHAKQLEDRGLVEIIGDADEDEEEEGEKGGNFTITDNTGKEKEKAEQDTDKSDPTGKEKSDKAGPSATKKEAPKRAAPKKK